MLLAIILGITARSVLRGTGSVMADVALGGIICGW
jgi:hypothetical protein